jgi:hypothetical protein
MLFRARDPAFVRGQFDTLLKYRGAHFAVNTLNPLRSSMRNLRSKWYAAPTASEPDPRVTAIVAGWPTYGIQWAIQALYELNPAFVRDISHEGDPLRDNPLYNHTTGQWLVTLPAADTKGAEIGFPAAIWTPAALIANHPALVPPATEAQLPDYVLAKWVAAFHVANGGPGPDWQRYEDFHRWDAADYPARDSAASIDGLLKIMQDIGGNSWPLIALCYHGFGEPDFALKVMAEYRARGLSFANDTESNMFFYYFLSALRGLGPVQDDQHLSIGSGGVFKDAAGNRSYMVENKSDSYQLADVFQDGARIGQVLAYPKTTTLQRGLLDLAEGFAPIGTVPARDSVDVKVGQDSVAVIFNQAFDPLTLDNEVTITGPGSVSLVYKPGSSGQVAEYAVQGDWLLGCTYTINVPATVSNADRTATVGTARQFSFTIQGAFGLELVSTSPAAGSSNTDPSAGLITLNFNSRIDPATLSGVTLVGAGNPTLVRDVAAGSASKVVFRLGSDLQPGGVYTLTVPAGVADVYGQSLGAAQVVTFTTSQPSGVLADWPTTLNVSKFTQVASSGESIQVLAPGLIWNFDAVGDYVELSINAESGGTYEFEATNRVNPVRGIMKLAVNGVEQPAPYWDQTAGATPAAFDFGVIRLERGVNVLRFEVAALKAGQQPRFSLIDTFFTVVALDNPTVPGPFAEVGGLVVLEAENYMANNPVTVGGVERSWNLTTERPGYAGAGAMRSLPNTGVNIGAAAVATGAPRIDYEVQFTTPGVYRVWVRGDAAGSDPDDSLHIGLDGATPATAKDISLERANGFVWSGTRMFTAVKASLVVAEAGVHTVNLWMREDGAYVDRILLTTDENYIPLGEGPVASERLMVVVGDGDPEPEPDPTPIVEPRTGTYTETGGVVVVEAEDFTVNTPVTAGPTVRVWENVTNRPGYIGAGALRSTPNTGVNVGAVSVSANSPRVDYEITFTTPGTYTVWVRGDAAGGDGDDSLHIGLDGVVLATSADISLERADGFVWTSKRMTSAEPATLVIASAGVRTLNLWMREDGAHVDRILLTIDPAYVPAGGGPAVAGFTPTGAAASSIAAGVASSSALVAGASSGPAAGDTFVAAGTHDYLLVPDEGGLALHVEFLLAPALLGNGYHSLDGLDHPAELPEFSTPHDIDGDGLADYFETFAHGQPQPPAPGADYDDAAGAFSVFWRDESGAFATRLYSSPDAANWSLIDSSFETIDPATDTRGYELPWSAGSGTPLFIRVEVGGD